MNTGDSKFKLSIECSQKCGGDVSPVQHQPALSTGREAVPTSCGWFYVLLIQTPPTPPPALHEMFLPHAVMSLQRSVDKCKQHVCLFSVLFLSFLQNPRDLILLLSPTCKIDW